MTDIRYAHTQGRYHKSVVVLFPSESIYGFRILIYTAFQVVAIQLSEMANEGKSFSHIFRENSAIHV